MGSRLLCQTKLSDKADAFLLQAVHDCGPLKEKNDRSSPVHWKTRNRLRQVVRAETRTVNMGSRLLCQTKLSDKAANMTANKTFRQGSRQGSRQGFQIRLSDKAVRRVPRLLRQT